MKRDRKEKIAFLIVLVFVMLSALIFLLQKQELLLSPLGGDYGATSYGEGVYAGPSLPIVPILSISQPTNTSYLNSLVRVLLSASNANNCWYILDEVRTDASCNSDFALPRLSVGEHNITIYANNSDGVSSERRTFNISYNRRFIVKYFEFSGMGSTTNLDSLTDNEIENISLILHIPNYGQIAFTDRINLTASADLINNITDIDAEVNISFNRVEVNSALMPSLNKKAKLTLEDLSFSDPRVMKDGGVCGSSECIEESYSGGDFIFNVTVFSVYSAQESPGSGSSSSSSSSSNSGSINVVPKTTPSPPVSNGEVTVNNNEQTIQRYTIGESVNLIDASDGEQIALITSDGQEEVATIIFKEGGIILRVTSGQYSINTGETVKVIIGSNEVYFGVKEVVGGNAKIAFSTNKAAVTNSIGGKNLAGIILWIVIILLILGIIVVVIIIIYYLINDNESKKDRGQPNYPTSLGKDSKTINFINNKGVGKV